MREEYGGKTPVPEREGNKEGRTEREGNKEGRTWASLLFAFSHHKDTLCVNKLSMVFVFFLFDLLWEGYGHVVPFGIALGLWPILLHFLILASVVQSLVSSFYLPRFFLLYIII